MYPDPPFQSWPAAQFQDFKQLLRQLEGVGLPNNLQSWTQVSSEHLKFCFSLGVRQLTIQTDFANWFVHFYSQQGPALARKIWSILLQNQPASQTAMAAIR
jgi:hypothetical protein